MLSEVPAGIPIWERATVERAIEKRKRRALKLAELINGCWYTNNGWRPKKNEQPDGTGDK